MGTYNLDNIGSNSEDKLAGIQAEYNQEKESIEVENDSENEEDSQ